ncbi:uncharacterized protein CC84DRAFT_1160358 [Paraphaeosphaeria sporulosa]|uniref:Uncharacterized protein n=1 Tax=Paraphaeosphaeria sporulosa TaxID=1460663 RepID=A0A177D0D5_9PLEO|nr:uncharacterized protein CC84DRAFT_1160358 [Paraphaeosphaeria sporulosa]OAG13144.1 hypothetical protein CC84DRAFT_1160358 [Paraphaeosphaeria sporulosa]
MENGGHCRSSTAFDADILFACGGAPAIGGVLPPAAHCIILQKPSPSHTYSAWLGAALYLRIEQHRNEGRAACLSLSPGPSPPRQRPFSSAGSSAGVQHQSSLSQPSPAFAQLQPASSSTMSGGPSSLLDPPSAASTANCGLWWAPIPV